MKCCTFFTRKIDPFCVILLFAPRLHAQPAWFDVQQFFNVDWLTGKTLLTYGVVNYESNPSYLLEMHRTDGIYDSGWFEFNCEEFSFLELEHNIGETLMAVTVRINATDGDNEGFTFMGGSGLSMTSGTLASYYGGLLFGYNSSTVRLWAPSNFTFGGIVNINQGFGNTNLQTSQSADVRVEVSPMVAADFDSGWFEMGKSRAQHDVRHGLGDLTYSIVRVYVRVRSGENEGFIFEGVGAAQNDGSAVDTYGGVVFAYNDQFVRLYAANSTEHSYRAV